MKIVIISARYMEQNALEEFFGKTFGAGQASVTVSFRPRGRDKRTISVLMMDGCTSLPEGVFSANCRAPLPPYVNAVPCCRSSLRPSEGGIRGYESVGDLLTLCRILKCRSWTFRSKSLFHIWNNDGKIVSHNGAHMLHCLRSIRKCQKKNIYVQSYTT